MRPGYHELFIGVEQVGGFGTIVQTSSGKQNSDVVSGLVNEQPIGWCVVVEGLAVLDAGGVADVGSAIVDILVVGMALGKGGKELHAHGTFPMQ